MTSPTTNTTKAELWTNPQFVYDIADYTMQNYHRSQEMDASPVTGFCIPITPHTRLTNSPTGGVVGRYLAKRTPHAATSCTTLTSSEGSSENGSPALSQEMIHNPYLAMQQHFLGGQEAVVDLELASQLQDPTEIGFMEDIVLMAQEATAVRGQLPLAQQFGTGNNPAHAQRQQPFQPIYSRSGNILLTSKSTAGNYTSPKPALTSAVTRKKPASTASGKSSASHKPLDPADINFLFKTLDQQLKASNNVSLMTRLVPVHQGRPGQHILRLNEHTGELYACIPCNPFVPKSTVGQQEYSLPSYDSYIQEKANGGRRAKEPYPAMGHSSLNTCNHCQTPTKVLNNESLCPFHAYYIATGRFLGYYEFCALVEMEKHGLSISSGWWTIEDMVQFVDALTQRIDKWRFVEESSAIPKGSWISRVSPFGAIGREVPQRARGKTAFQFGAEQTLAMAVGRQPDQTTMGRLRLDQMYREATGAIFA